MSERKPYGASPAPAVLVLLTLVGACNRRERSKAGRANSLALYYMGFTYGPMMASNRLTVSTRVSGVKGF